MANTMINFSNTNLFIPVTHPQSGVTSYVLTHRVAPVQQGFYFLNDSMSTDVHFMNRDTGKIIVLAEHAERADYIGRNYHIDPHPRFCSNDQYVVFTTTVHNEIDLAIVPVAHLIEKTL